MRFAAIADIHGNAPALEAVLAGIEAAGIVDIFNLGDHYSGPREAGRTADLLLSRAMAQLAATRDRTDWASSLASGWLDSL